ncbi:hypothetical protein [Bradyrhizobium sp. CCBAU 11357]|uniref:hypothetical protein n=1 Tax=Bradyrhizobium sp. CCBAU 11357 TaxID=1630808 RepID=UPI002302F3A4|nr:hypothetical protein [Bradyrhizobium sp. CCBAU 11357]
MGGRDDQGLYDHAGPGAKRRKRRSIQNIPREISTARHPRPKIVREKLAHQEHKTISGRELKRKIWRLTLKGKGPRDIHERIKREGIPATLVTISGVRTQMLETIKFLREKELINERRLERYQGQ